MPGDCLVAWTWDDGWVLVRPTTRARLLDLLLRAEDEAEYRGEFDNDEDIGHLVRWEAYTSVLFLLDPHGTVVRVVKFAGRDASLLSESLIVPQVPAEPMMYGIWYGEEGRRILTMSQEASDRWFQGVLRVYGMLSLFGAAVSVDDRVFEPMSPVTTGDAALDEFANLGPLIDQAFEDQVEALRPWLLEGRSPDADAEVYLLLGQLPPAFTVPLLRAP